MKNLTILTISLLLLVSYGLKSQTLLNETSVNLFGNKEKGAKLTLKTITCESGNLQIRAFIQRKATVDNKKAFKVLKEGYFPAIKIFNLNKDLSGLKVIYKNINLNSLTGSNADYRLLANKIEEIGNNNDDLKYEELQKQYPDVLMPKDTKPETEKYFIDMERNVKKKIYESNFDVISNSILETETGIKTINLEYPETDLLRKKFGYGLSDDKNNKFIFASGLFYDKKERKADPTKKYNEFRQYEFNSFDRTGKCLNTYNINFDYPKIIKYNSKVVTNGKFDGFVYVFGYMPGAKKYNNKETANKYWAVYFDNNGKHIFTKEFESDNGTIFHTVHKFNDNLFFFVLGKDAKYGIIKISADNYEQKNFGIQDLKENTINGEYTSGLKRSFTPTFENINVFVNNNGDFIIIPENKKSKTVKKGDKTVTINTYNSFALQFNTNGDFVKQYILPGKNPKSKSFSKTYELITYSPDKFVLISNEVISKYKPKSYSTFYTSSGKTVNKDKMEYLISPVVTVINISENKLNSATLSKETFYRLSKDILYCYDNSSNHIYFVGTDKSRSKLVISKLSF